MGSSRTMRSASRASDAQDLDLLLLGDRQAPDDGPAVEVEAGLRGEPRRIARRSDRRSMNPARRGSAPRKTFWATVRPRDEGHLLGDDGDPAHQRLARGAERHRRPPQDQVALILREHAGDDLAEGRLAGAVLADEGVDRAGPDLDRDVVERAGRPEGLPEPADLQVDGVAASPSPTVGTPTRSRRQPGHSASGRNVSTLALVTTPPSGSAVERIHARRRRAGPDGVDELFGAEAAFGRRHLHDGAVALAAT